MVTSLQLTNSRGDHMDPLTSGETATKEKQLTLDSREWIWFRNVYQG